MARIITKLEVFRKQSTGTYPSSASFTIDNVSQHDQDVEITTTADSFSFTMGNPNQLYSFGAEKYFDVEDKVNIYITSNTSISSSDMVFNGVIGAITHTVGDKKITVEGQNFLEKILNSLKLGNYTGLPASTIIQNIISSVNDDQIPGQKITWAATNATTSETINYYRRYMPAFQMIEELSRKETNIEGDYYYYLDNDNAFHWKLKSDTPESTEFSEGTDFTKLKAKKSVYDVITALVVDVGLDPYSRPITAIDYNITLSAQYGLKWGNTVEPKDFSTILMRECRSTATGGALDGSYGPWSRDDEDPDPDRNFPTAADYSTSWGGDTGFKVPWASGGTHKIGSTVYSKGDDMYLTTDAEFTAEIRYEARRLGKIWIQDILRRTGIPRWKVDGKMTGRYFEENLGKPTPGNLYFINSVTFGWNSSTNPKKERLKHIGHTLNKKGWVVDVHFEEDPGIIQT